MQAPPTHETGSQGKDGLKTGYSIDLEVNSLIGEQKVGMIIIFISEATMSRMLIFFKMGVHCGCGKGGLEVVTGRVFQNTASSFL